MSNKRKLLWSILAIIFITVTGCQTYSLVSIHKKPSEAFTGSVSAPKSSKSNRSNPFRAQEAIQKVISLHPHFPSDPNQIYHQMVYTGGPLFQDPKTKKMHPPEAHISLTTTVQFKGNHTFLITFTKNWHLKVNNIPVISIWAYRVTPKGYTVVKNQNRDQLPKDIR